MTQEQQYVLGFNHGYLLTKHLPELATTLATGIQPTTNDYVDGFYSGKEEYELEVSREQLDELRNIRCKSHDRGNDMEQGI